MASTYTVNLGIEKIGTGEQSGTWGTTTNTNFDLIDQAINGAVTVTLASAGTSGSPNTLAITDGTVSDGRNKFIDFADGGDLGAAAYVQLTPNDAEKLVHIRNSLSGGRSIFVFQGTYNASNDFEIPNGKDVVLKFDGGGATATVTQVFEDLLVTAVAATTVDTTNIEVTNLKAKDGTSAGSIADSTGVVTLASSVLTTTDINGGSVDGVTLGTNSAVTEAQIDNININGNTISSTDTNGNVTITPDGTGSVAISKIDVAGGEIDGTAIGANSASTAVFTNLTASGTVSFSGATVSNGGTVTTVNIDGGSIDGTIIGAASTAAGSFTTITASDDVNFDSGTFFVDASADAVGIGTTSPSTKLQVNGNVYLGGAARNIYADNGSGIFFNGLNNFGSGIYSDGSGTALKFQTSSTDRIILDSSGNVGISVTPSAWGTFNALQVGYTNIGGFTSGNNAFLSSNAYYSGSGWVYQGSYAATYYQQLSGQHIWYNAASGTAGNAISFTQAMTLDASGNLGIGTTSPNAALKVQGPVDTATISTSSTPAARINNGGAISNWIGANGYNYGYIQSIQDDGTNNLKPLALQPLGGSVGIGTTSPAEKLQINDGRLRFLESGQRQYNIGVASGTPDFQIYDATFSYAPFTLDGSGNVGIGTASPSSFNQVGADTLVVGSGSGEQGITIYSGTANNGVVAFADGTTTTEQYKGYIGYNHLSNYMRFFTDASERMRIDSSGNVGIGSTAPSAKFTNYKNTSISGSSGATLSLELNTEPRLLLTSDSSTSYISSFDDNPIVFSVTAGNFSSSTGTERMRIDSSGNLLVGNTSYNDALAGALISQNGRIYATVDGNPPYTANRLTSDGDIFELKKDNSTVGRIGSVSGYLYIGGTAGNDAFLSLGDDGVRPATSAGAARDDAIDLGGVANRFRNAYLSGSVYLGGTGAANALDDYEEGTWTPTSGTNSTVNTVGSAFYTKVGRQVTVYTYITSLDITSNSITLGGLPFTAGIGYGPAAVYYAAGGATVFAGNSYTENTTTTLNITFSSTFTGAAVMISATYFA